MIMNKRVLKSTLRQLIFLSALVDLYLRASNYSYTWKHVGQVEKVT